MLPLAYTGELIATQALMTGQVITDNHNKSQDIRPRPRVLRPTANPPGDCDASPSPLRTNRAPRNWLRRVCLRLFEAIQLRRPQRGNTGHALAGSIAILITRIAKALIANDDLLSQI